MTEDNSKEQESLSIDRSDSPGFAFGDEATVSYPDQVKAAIEYARANTYEYGPRLRELELKWDVISVEPMSDGIVRVRLKYSPVSSFRGDPGVEYMDVDSGGSILARRQINVPKENKPVVLMGITAFSVVLAAVLISLMTVFKQEGGDSLYVAGRTLWIRAEQPKSQQFIIYRGADTTGTEFNWAITPEDVDNNEMVYVQINLINQTSGTVRVVVDESSAVLLDGNRASHFPVDTLDRAYTAEFDAKFNVPEFVPLWGSVTLNENEQVIGMLVFELPKDSSFSELRWTATDTATIRYQ